MYKAGCSFYQVEQMSFSLLTIANFRNLFKGNDNFKGITTITTSVVQANTKVEAQCRTDKSSITNDDIIKHLEGKQGLGVCPITEEGKVNFSVIDVDDYSNNVKHCIDSIYKYNIPLIPFMSKSGGLHLYVFYKNPVSPSDAKDAMNELRILLGLPANTEIFPKQRSKEWTNYGSWINLPYFDANSKSNKRKLIQADGTMMSLDAALKYCDMSRVDLPELKQKLADLPLNDAPPCLQSLYLSGVEENRNEYLFSLAVYFKSKYEDSYESELMSANESLSDPLPESEVRNTVLKTMEKKTYSYKCDSPLLSCRCNKQVCSNRQFGKGCDKIASLNFEEFHQYMTEPPYYEWVINGTTLRFYEEEDIINQKRFRELCMRQLHKLPNKLSDPKWSQIVNNAMDNVIVHEIPEEEDLSTGSIWWRYTCEFFLNRVLADTPTQVKIGRAYKDKEQGIYIFRGGDYIEYLKSKGFRAYTEVEIKARLSDKGAKVIQYRMPITGSIMSVWSINAQLIDTHKVDIKDVDIDFYDKETGDERF